MSSTAISYLDSLIRHKLVVVMPAFNEGKYYRQCCAEDAQVCRHHYRCG